MQSASIAVDVAAWLVSWSHRWIVAKQMDRPWWNLAFGLASFLFLLLLAELKLMKISEQYWYRLGLTQLYWNVEIGVIFKRPWKAGDIWNFWILSDFWMNCAIMAEWIEWDLWVGATLGPGYIMLGLSVSLWRLKLLMTLSVRMFTVITSDGDASLLGITLSILSKSLTSSFVSQTIHFLLLWAEYGSLHETYTVSWIWVFARNLCHWAVEFRWKFGVH